MQSSCLNHYKCVNHHLHKQYHQGTVRQHVSYGLTGAGISFRCWGGTSVHVKQICCCSVVSAMFGFLRWILLRLPSSHWSAVKGGGREWGKWAACMIQGFQEKFAPSFSYGFFKSRNWYHLFLCISLVSIWSSCSYVCCAFGEEKMCWVVCENCIFCFSHHFPV